VAEYLRVDVLKQYNLPFYLQYLVRWPEYFEISETPSGRRMGYIMGKAEGQGENWHGHVTAVTVAPEFRKIGLAQLFMFELEDISEKRWPCALYLPALLLYRCCLLRPRLNVSTRACEPVPICAHQT
jgi:ribosomal protein S18 acetylase RimI-like enzyme